MKILSVDIGGTNVKYGLIEDENFIYKSSFKTPDKLKLLLNKIQDIYNENKDEIEGIAFSINARCRSEKGEILSGSSNDYLNRTHFSKMVSRLCDNKKVTIYNDANCAALAESKSGSLKNVKNGMIMTVGTGIGGAIVIDSKVINSRHFNIGELSFLPYEDGCAWQYLKINQLFEIYKKRSNKKVKDGEEFFKIYQNDDNAKKALIEYIDRFMPILQMIVCLVDPEVIVLGGGISKQKEFIDIFNQRIEKYKSKYDFAYLKLKACKYYNDANLLGAYYYYLENKK